MTVLYVREQGAVVRRDGEQVKVTRRDPAQQTQTVLQTISVRELEQVVVYGNVQVTTQAVALLLDHEVDIVFLSMHGAFRWRITRNDSRFARLRHAQLRLAGNDAGSLALARAIVRTKLANQHHLLLALAERVPPTIAPLLRNAGAQIDQMRLASSRAGDTEVLRGFEGRAGASYFGALKALLHAEWGFQGRAFHPPPDPFNALLSFGYTLLLKDINAVIQLVGLDPYVGCFHALEYDRPSLALDLMEEFRPLAVDAPLLDLVLVEKILPRNFTQTGQSARPVVLGSEYISVVIGAYEERLNQYVLHRPSGNRRRLRDCLSLQARIFERVVLGTRGEYEGMVA